MGSTDYRLDSLEEPVDVAKYLFRRLHQVGIKSVHGLPGDYNLASLDYVSECGLRWVGNVNELNAGKCCLPGRMSALMTTFGVGELSALNGMAGAFAEQVPLVHIVGCPSTTSEQNGLLLHHTLGNGDYNVFKTMSSLVSCYVAKLNQPNLIAHEIDTAIRECWIRSKPVYIMVPSDMINEKIEGARLKTPIDLSDPPNDPEKEAYAVDVILKYLYAARNPIILVDACAIRHRVSDLNTAGFSYRLSQLNTIDLHSTHCTVRYSEYPGVTMKGVLQKIIKTVDTTKLSAVPSPQVENQVAANDDGSQTITQYWLWPRIGEYPREDDIVITETGTASFGIWETKFPKGFTALNQTIWGSIGWSVGACQGAALAAKDAGLDRRTVLFVGDGSYQLTAQEVSTIIRHGLRVTLFCICNEGYTIERFIHGAEAEYNDIAPWRFKNTPAAFGASGEQVSTHTVRTKQELDALLSDRDFNEARNLQFVELHVPKMDAPRPLVMVANAAAKNNSKA
ncbi:pyruvate decarboxylase protein [Diaporthe eres]|nr:pyruvate decarboxylase protein [Diaporthe eres]